MGHTHIVSKRERLFATSDESTFVGAGSVLDHIFRHQVLVLSRVVTPRHAQIPCDDFGFSFLSFLFACSAIFLSGLCPCLFSVRACSECLRSRIKAGGGGRKVHEKDKNRDKGTNKDKNREHPDQRDHWMMRGRSAPRGKSAAAMRLKAYRKKLAMREAARRRSPESGMLSVGGIPQASTPWVALGPAPLISDQNVYGAVAGRVTAVAIDPSDASGNTVYVPGLPGEFGSL